MKKLLVTLLLLPAIVCSCGRVELGNDDNPPYEVGDVIIKDSCAGIVFYVTDGGWHGKVVSTDEAMLQWSIDEVKTGATDPNDGMANMRKIQQISNWYDMYPAFAWCSYIGDGWYLPALNELKILYESGVLKGEGMYWSSTETEDNEFYAWGVYMDDDYTGRSLKSSGCYVRAVRAF